MAKYSVPKNVFLHLLMIAMLYTTVISLMFLLTAYINVLFPDQLDYIYGYGFSWVHSTIRFASSSLLVAFLVFMLSNWLIGREMKKSKEVKESFVRKWLIYLTLFVAAVTIVIYLVMLVHSFYNGDLTLTFFLKVLVVLAITAFVFTYYMMDLHDKIKHGRAVMIVVAVLVATSLIAGFFIVGSPMHQRKVRFDEQRSSHLQDLQWQVTNYWQTKGALPTELAELSDSISGYMAPVDPISGEAYTYRVVSDMTFEFCATFETENLDKYSDDVAMQSIKFDSYDFWRHGIGETCFERTIDPDLYPPY